MIDMEEIKGTKKKLLSQNQIVKIMDSVPQWPQSISKARKYLCGKKIANGSFRWVYEFRFDPEHYVVKIDHSGTMFANITEFRNYMNYDSAPLQEWMCPIVGITDDGKIMIMRRAEMKTKYSDYPKEVPVAFTDRKIENWGFVDGRCVCVDYSFILADQKNFRKARWWSQR
jgi:hypothetical protein